MQSANKLPFFTRKLFNEATSGEFNSDPGYSRNYYDRLKDFAQYHSTQSELNQLLKAFHSLHHPAHNRDVSRALEEIYKYEKFLQDFDEYFAQLNFRNSTSFNNQAAPISELPEIQEAEAIDVSAIVASEHYPKQPSQIAEILSDNNAEKPIKSTLPAKPSIPSIKLIALSNTTIHKTVKGKFRPLNPTFPVPQRLPRCSSENPAS